MAGRTAQVNEVTGTVSHDLVGDQSIRALSVLSLWWHERSLGRAKTWVPSSPKLIDVNQDLIRSANLISQDPGGEADDNLDCCPAYRSPLLVSSERLGIHKPKLARDSRRPFYMEEI